MIIMRQASRVELGKEPSMEDMSQSDLRRNIMIFHCSTQNGRDQWKGKKEKGIDTALPKYQTMNRII